MSRGGRHYTALFAVYMVPSSSGNKQQIVLLSVSPMIQLDDENNGEGNADKVSITSSLLQLSLPFFLPLYMYACTVLLYTCKLTMCCSHINRIQLTHEEGTCFDADHHIHTFKDLGLGFENGVIDFALCQTADSAGVCVKIARLLNMPHVSCNNHNLSLKVKLMQQNDTHLARIGEKIAEIASVFRK